MKGRILFISPFSLSNRGGGGLASLAYYNALAELFPGKVDLAMPQEGCKGAYQNAIAIPPRTRILAVLSGCLHRYKSFVKSFFHSHEGIYEWVVLNSGFYFGDSINFFKKRGIKVLMIHHNFEKEYAITNKTIFSLYGHFPYFIVKNEKRAYLQADINCFLTKADKNSFLKEYGRCKAPCYCIGVYDAERTTYTKTKDNDSKHVVITGTLSDFQTYRSIEIFAESIYPSMHQHYPEIILTLAGRNPASSVCNFADNNKGNVCLIPNPENMDDVLNKNTIFVCPTSSGGGQKLRIMDGLRKGMPILVHVVSARGYDMFFEEPFFQIYNDESSFIEGLTKIFTYIETTKDYKERIIEHYIQCFSFEAGKRRMEQAVSSAE